MSERIPGESVVSTGSKLRSLLKKARGPLWCLVAGLVVGTWIGGGPDRFGEEESFAGSLRGAGRTMVKGYRYTAAMLRDGLTLDRSSVRKFGLAQQIETRLWQDKRLVADSIVVEVEDGGTAVLKGIVPDVDNKDRAVSLARDTRGVEKVVDELAVRPSSRTINATPGPPVPTGVASIAQPVR